MNEDEVTPEVAPSQSALSISEAAAMMGRVRTGAEQPRAETGQFQAKEKEAEPEKQPVDKVVDLKTKQPVKAEEPPAEEEEEYFEFAPEKDGEAPRRVKLDDVLAAYEELPKVKGELEKVSKVQPPPEQYVQAIEEAVRERTKMINSLQMLQQIINPQEPSLEMLNAASDKYDPDGYYAAKTRAEQQRADLRAINAEMKRQSDKADEETAALGRAHSVRETAALLKAWPEFEKEQTKRDFIDGLRGFGFKDEEIGKISDHRQMLVIRDALKLRALEAEKAKAVQVVRQKPKLVKGAARSSTDSKASARSTAMERLRATGSEEAAAQALKGLV